MGNNYSTTDWTDVFSRMKKIHDQVYYTIDEAIKLEENEQPYKALQKYKSGVQLIDEVCSIQVECPAEKEDTWETACSMIDKMKQTRAEVMMRINVIQSSPSYLFDLSQQEESASTANSNNETPLTCNELASALETIQVKAFEGSGQVIYSQNNIRLHFISHDGVVRASQDPGILNIYFIEGNETSISSFFLQIGDWVYPLIQNVSPCYRTEYGAFIFPDITSTPGSAVGIKFPNDVDENEFLEILKSVLNGAVKEFSSVQSSVQRQRRETGVISNAVSNTLINSAYYISQGLVKGAEKAGQLLNYATPKVINYISSTENPTPVSEGLVQTFRTARNASGTAVEATSYIAGKVSSATAALGRYLAPHIRKQGTRLITSGFNITEEKAHENVNSIFTVTAGAVEGLATVYSGLEESAQILGRSLVNNTVVIVEHKYGEPIAEITGNTLYTVGNICTASNNLNYLKPKGFIKSTAKEASKAVVQDCAIKNSDANIVTYPNLSEFEKEATNIVTYPNLSEFEKEALNK